MFKNVNFFLIGVLLFSTACSNNKNESSVGNQQNVQTAELAIDYDPAKIADQSVADAFNLGPVKPNSEVVKRIVLANKLSMSLPVSLADLSTKIGETTRFELRGNHCPAVLKSQQKCYFDIALKHVVAEDYLPAIETKVVSHPSNDNFGKIIISGSKAADVSSLSPLATVLRLNQYTDSIAFKSGSISKRYYISNISNENVIAPSITLTSQATLVNNSCNGVILRPNKACNFSVSYAFDSNGGQKNENISFSSVDRNSTGFQLNVSIDNQPTVVPSMTASVTSTNSFSSILASNTKRIYVSNTSQVTADLSNIVIPAPYKKIASSCSLLKVGKTCYIDVQLDSTKTANMVSASVAVSILDKTVYINAGTSSNSNSIVCSSGFSADNGTCVSSSNPGLSYSEVCLIPNAQFGAAQGTRSTTDGGQTWSSCVGGTCGSDINGSQFIEIGGSCVEQNQSRVCQSQPANSNSGHELSIDGGLTWGACSNFSCNPTFSNVAGSCVSSHVERSCQVQPDNSVGGIEVSEDGGQNFSACSGYVCNSTSYMNGSNCIAQTNISVLNDLAFLVYTDYDETNVHATSVDSLYDQSGQVDSHPSTYLGSQTVPATSNVTGTSIVGVSSSASAASSSLLPTGLPMVSQKHTDTNVIASINSVSSLTETECSMENSFAQLTCSVDLALQQINITVPKSVVKGSGIQTAKFLFNNNSAYRDFTVSRFKISQFANTTADVAFNGTVSASTLSDNPVFKAVYTPTVNGQPLNVMMVASNNKYGAQKLYAFLEDGSIHQISNTANNDGAGDVIGLSFVFNGKFYFAAQANTLGSKLFRFSLDANGNGEVVQISNINLVASDGFGSDAVEFNGKMYFGCGNSASTRKVCEMGTDEVISQVSNTRNNSAVDDNPNSFIVFNNELYFSANTSSGSINKLHKMTASKTISQVRIINASASITDGFGGGIVLGSKLYFKANNGSYSKVFAMDTNYNVTQLTNLFATNDLLGSGFPLRSYNDELYFAGSDSKIYKLNPIDGVVSKMTNFNPGGNDALLGFFSTQGNIGVIVIGGASATSYKMYRITKGNNVRQLTDVISGGSDFSSPFSARGMNNKIYFSMKNSSNYQRTAVLETGANP